MNNEGPSWSPLRKSRPGAVIGGFLCWQRERDTPALLFPSPRREVANVSRDPPPVVKRIVEPTYPIAPWLFGGLIFVLGLVTMRLDGFGTDDIAASLKDLKD